MQYPKIRFIYVVFINIFFLLVTIADDRSYEDFEHGQFPDEDIDFGGWKPPHSCMQNHCDFERHFDVGLSPEDLKMPSVIVHTSIQNTDHWKKDYFLSKYGESVIEVGHSVGITTFDGSGSDYMRIKDFLSHLNSTEEDRKFVFDSKMFLQSHPEILEEIVNPLPVKNIEHWWPIFSLGGDGDGLPFHSHGATWLRLMYGTKRWFAYPPGIMPTKALPSHALQTVDEWLIQNYPSIAADKKVKPFQCIQHPGDIVYIPAGWSHATFNLGETIAIGQQAPWGIPQKLLFGEEAISKAEKVAEFSLSFARANLGRAQLKMSETTKGFSSFGFKTRALENFRKAVEIRPIDLRSLFVLSVSEFTKEDRMSARQAIENILSEEAARGTAATAIASGLHRLARDYLEDDEVDTATGLLGWAADLVPNSTPVSLEAGAAYLAIEEWDRAYTLLSKAVDGLNLLPLDDKTKKEVKDMLVKCESKILSEK